MYKHILIATDGSDLAQTAVGQGMALARAVGAKVLIVTVTEPWRSTGASDMVITFPLEDYEKRASDAATVVFGKATDIARKVGVAYETDHVMDKYPAEGIVEAAEKHGCDLIVMASHGRRGLSRMFLGSQAAKVVTLSKVPVLICR